MTRFFVRTGLTLFVVGMTRLSGAAEKTNPTPPIDAVPPTVTASICEQAPFLDGVLTDTCWQTAGMVSNLSVSMKPDETVAHKIYITRDDQWLYLAAELAHPVPKYVKQTVFAPDGNVQDDDSLEVFLDPGTGGAFCQHYALNAANIKSDEVIFADGDKDRRGRMPWRSATRLTAKGWNAELAIPIAELTRYHAGPDRSGKKFPCDLTKTRLNILVTTVKPIFDLYSVRTSEEKQLAEWASPTAGFGTLLGIPSDAKTRPVFLPVLAGVEVGRYEFAGGQAFYRVKALVRNSTDNDTGRVEVVVSDRPVAGAVSEARQRQVLSGKRDQEVVTRAPLTTPGQRTAVVWLNDGDRGGAFDSRLLDEQTMRATDPFAAWLDRSYYTSEKEAYVVCRLRLPEEKLSGQRALVKDRTGKTVGALDRLSGDCRIAVALDQFNPGRHLITIEWYGKDGERMATRTEELIILSPKPGCEVKIDQVNDVVVKDGQPIFPFGLIVKGLSGKDEDYFRRIAEAGYNTIVWWAREPDIDAREYRTYLDVAGKYGLLVLDAVGRLQPVPPYNQWARGYLKMKTFNKKTFSDKEEVEIALDDFEQILPDLKRTWEMGLQSPNLLGHYSVDEPNSNGNTTANLAVMERFYRELRKLDPYRAVAIAFSCNIPAGAAWTQWGEILGYDPYVYPGFGHFDYGEPNFVAKKTIELKRRADSARRAVWIVPMACSLDVGRTPRTLTAAEQNSQTYLAIIHGAKGLLYFVNTALYAQPSWDALSDLARQTQVLGPAIVASAVPREIVYRPIALDSDKKIFPEVQSELFRHPDGRYILLAANGANYPVRATFAVSGLRRPDFWRRLMGDSAVEVLFNPRDLEVNDNTFTDELESYGVRAYALPGLTPDDSAPTAEAKIAITVSMAPVPEKEAVGKILPVDEMIKRKSLTMNKKNKVANPSVELMSVPGIPDNIRPNMYLNWPLVGAAGALWGLDTDNPFHGEQCLRLSHQFKGGEPPKGDESNWRITAGMCYLPPIKQPTRYTFSLYARAKRDGEELGLYIGGMTPQAPKERWKLTRDWKRYSFTGAFANGGNQGFYLYTFSKDAIVWIDALQLEVGDAPTAFTLE